MIMSPSTKSFCPKCRRRLFRMPSRPSPNASRNCAYPSPLRAFRLAGNRPSPKMVATHGEAFADNQLDSKQLFSDARITLPISADGSPSLRTQRPPALAFWASGEYRKMFGDTPELEWDGDLTGNLYRHRRADKQSRHPRFRYLRRACVGARQNQTAIRRHRRTTHRRTGRLQPQHHLGASVHQLAIRPASRYVGDGRLWRRQSNH